MRTSVFPLSRNFKNTGLPAPESERLQQALDPALGEQRKLSALHVKALRLMGLCQDHAPFALTDLSSLSRGLRQAHTHSLHQLALTHKQALQTAFNLGEAFSPLWGSPPAPPLHSERGASSLCFAFASAAFNDFGRAVGWLCLSLFRAPLAPVPAP